MLAPTMCPVLLPLQVHDDVVSRLAEIDSLCDMSKGLMDLMFNLTGYRSTVSGQVLAGISVVFLPLTWISGIYGTNFAVRREGASFQGLGDQGWGLFRCWPASRSCSFR